MLAQKSLSRRFYTLLRQQQQVNLKKGREERKKEGGWQEKGTVGSGFLQLRRKRRVTRNKE